MKPRRRTTTRDRCWGRTQATVHTGAQGPRLLQSPVTEHVSAGPLVSEGSLAQSAHVCGTWPFTEQEPRPPRSASGPCRGSCRRRRPRHLPRGDAPCGTRQRLTSATAAVPRRTRRHGTFRPLPSSAVTAEGRRASRSPPPARACTLVMQEALPDQPLPRAASRRPPPGAGGGHTPLPALWLAARVLAHCHRCPGSSERVLVSRVTMKLGAGVGFNLFL